MSLLAFFPGCCFLLKKRYLYGCDLLCMPGFLCQITTIYPTQKHHPCTPFSSTNKSEESCDINSQVTNNFCSLKWVTLDFKVLWAWARIFAHKTASDYPVLHQAKEPGLLCGPVSMLWSSSTHYSNDFSFLCVCLGGQWWREKASKASGINWLSWWKEEVTFLSSGADYN